MESSEIVIDHPKQGKLHSTYKRNVDNQPFIKKQRALEQQEAYKLAGTPLPEAAAAEISVKPQAAHLPVAPEQRVEKPSVAAHKKLRSKSTPKVPKKVVELPSLQKAA